MTVKHALRAGRKKGGNLYIAHIDSTQPYTGDTDTDIGRLEHPALAAAVIAAANANPDFGDQLAQWCGQCEPHWRCRQTECHR